jgi:hypothetical protein
VIAWNWGQYVAFVCLLGLVVYVYLISGGKPL